MATTPIQLSDSDLDSGSQQAPAQPVSLSSSDIDPQSQPGPVNPYSDAAMVGTAPREGFWHSLGATFGMTPEAAQAQRDEFTRHPVRSTIEDIGGPAVSGAEGLYRGFMRTTDEAGQAVTAAQQGKPYLAAEHAAYALPFVGEGIKRGVEQLGPDGEVTPASVGTALGTAIQTAPMLTGGREAVKTIETPGEVLPPPGELPPPSPPPPTPPTIEGGGAGGSAPESLQLGGGRGGVATATRTQTTQAPTVIPAKLPLAATLPPELEALQARASQATDAAHAAGQELLKAQRAQRAAQAAGEPVQPIDPELVQRAQYLRAQAQAPKHTAVRPSEGGRKGPSQWEADPAGRQTTVPSPAEVGADYVAKVKSGIPPQIAAAGLGMTRQDQETVHVAAFFTPSAVATAAASNKQPVAPQQTAPTPPPQSPNPVAMQQQAQQATIAETAAQAQGIKAKADDIAMGIPPPKPPQVPMPAGMDQGALTQDTVNLAGSVIMRLPAMQRPVAIRESVGKLANWMLATRTVVAPDGTVVNVDSQKTAQTEAVNVINNEIGRQNELIKAQHDAQQDAAKERQESAQQAQEERDEAIRPTETAKKSTGNAEPVEIPDTPATQKAAVALARAPMDATWEQLDALIRRPATVQ